jgi:hypothetical protein
MRATMRAKAGKNQSKEGPNLGIKHRTENIREPLLVQSRVPSIIQNQDGSWNNQL